MSLLWLKQEKSLVLLKSKVGRVVTEKFVKSTEIKSSMEIP